MAFDFPASPTIGQGFGSYVWDGEKWTLPGSGIPAAPIDALAFNGMQINGSMEVNQELGHSNNTLTSGAYAADGWRISKSGSMGVSVGTWPTGPSGFSHALGYGVATAQASLGAGDYAVVFQSIEGYRMKRLGWGAAGARPITLGFWSLFNTAGTFTGTIRNNANDRSYAFSFSQAAGVWQYNTVTIPGCTDGTWVIDNGIGMRVTFAMACGATLTAPSVGAWLNGNYLAGPGQTNGVSATSNVLYLTGVVVLPGTQAPSAAQSPLIMRPYDQELLTCKRYWQKAMCGLQIGNVTNGTFYSVVYPFSISPRAAPTVNALSNTTLTLFNQPFSEQISVDGFRATGQANGSGQGNFQTLFSVDARL